MSAALLALAWSLCEASAVPAARAGDARDREILSRLDWAFGTTNLGFDGVLGAGPRREDVYRAYVRTRLESTDFYDTLVPLLLPAVAMRHGSVLPRTLSSTKIGGRTLFYLGAPCRLDAAVEVEPWWAPGTRVRICRNSYLPDLKTDDQLPTLAAYCEATEFFTPTPKCGCGEHLLSCAKDEDQMKALNDASYKEITRTVHYVAQHHLPWSDLLSMNGTVRNGLGDIVYTRDRFFRTGSIDLRALSDAAFSLRPRDPPFEGGVLTAFRYVFGHANVRVVYSWMAQDFLCIELQSRSVHADVMFTIGDESHLNTREHVPLTKKIGCRDCHARLEYGIRAFSMFTPLQEGVRSRTDSDLPPRTFFYVRDSEDLRGEGPARPAYIGEMMARQPELDSCIVGRVEEILSGGTPVEPETHARRVAEFAKDRDFAHMFERIFLERFVRE
jgi:hypothetical protein